MIALEVDDSGQVLLLSFIAGSSCHLNLPPASESNLSVPYRILKHSKLDCIVLATSSLGLHWPREHTYAAAVNRNWKRRAALQDP